MVNDNDPIRNLIHNAFLLDQLPIPNLNILNKGSFVIIPIHTSVTLGCLPSSNQAPSARLATIAPPP